MIEEYFLHRYDVPLQLQDAGQKITQDVFFSGHNGHSVAAVIGSPFSEEFSVEMLLSVTESPMKTNVTTITSI